MPLRVPSKEMLSAVLMVGDLLGSDGGLRTAGPR